jgi:hypothetical protein
MFEWQAKQHIEDRACPLHHHRTDKENTDCPWNIGSLTTQPPYEAASLRIFFLNSLFEKALDYNLY